jgi:cytochrome P450
MSIEADTSGEDADSGAEGGGWGIYQLALADDPYPAWARLREASPVYAAGAGVFFVSSFALADQVVRDPGLRAGGGVAASLSTPTGLGYDPMARWLMALDGPPHDRARGRIRREFTAGQVARLRPLITSLAVSRVDAFLDRVAAGPADFVGEVALRLPSEVIRSLFSVDAAVWEEEVAPLFQASDSEPAAAIAPLATFFDEHARSAEGGLLAALRRPDADGNALAFEDVVSNAVLLVTAAIDTTTGLIANALHSLLQNDGVRARLAQDETCAGEVVEETLRFEPPALSCSRYAAEPLTLGGLAIPAGSHLLVGIGAANRDPSRYAEPDRFVLGRDWTGGLSFGGGKHFCLGASLARLEAREVLLSLARSGRLARLSLARPVSWRKDNPTIRAPRALWVEERLECE